MPPDSLEPPPLAVFSAQALARATDTLISSIKSLDLSFLHSLLFSPPIPASSPSDLYPLSAPLLINRPDVRGWGPIHHCVSAPVPSIHTLDALYCAGADIALFTTDNQQSSVLHVLAKSVQLPSAPANEDEDPEDVACELYQFVVHLIRDLRAPLTARDANDETCIHVAAEHGKCLELLLLLLDFDPDGVIRDSRNSRG
jgi:hypothetical protein